MLTNYFQTIRAFNRNIHLYLVATGLLGFTVDGGIYSVLFNLYLVRLGHGPEFIGIVNSAGLVAFAILSLPAGMLGSKFGNRRIMIIGLFIMVAGCILLPLAEFIPLTQQGGWLMTTYALELLGLSLYFVNVAPFAMSITTPAERNHVFSVQVALWSLAGFSGSLVGGLLPGLFSTLLGVSLDGPIPYRYPLWVAAILTVPAIIAIIGARSETNSTAKPETEVGFNLMKLGQASLIIIGVMTIIRLFQITSMSTTLTFFNLYLDTSLQVPTAQIGLIAALGRLFAVPAALVTPFLTARRGPAMVAIWASLGGSLSMLPMALIPHWGAAGLGFMGVVALSSIRYSAFLVYSMELVPPEQRGAMSGAGEMAAGLSFAMMAFGGGYLISLVGYPALFLTGAGLSALGTLILWVYLRRPRRQLGYPASEASLGQLTISNEQ